MYYRHITFGGGCHCDCRIHFGEGVWKSCPEIFAMGGMGLWPKEDCEPRTGAEGEWTRHCSIIPFKTIVLQRLSFLSLGGTQYIPGTESSTDGMRKKERGVGGGKKESIPTFKLSFSLSQELRRSLLEHYHANQINRQKLFKCFSCSCLDVDISQNPCLNLITIL